MNYKRGAVSAWLFTGVFMILVQILLGGITRLTGSGLSITEWDVIMGILPPMKAADWNLAFEKYKQFPQYKIVNSDMTLEGFKTIFWWEYLHRLWARLFVPVFVIPLIVFLIRGWMTRKLLWHLLVIFLLGALQGLVGWIMVASGLVNQPWVNPVKLSLHLMLALLLLCYLFWVALNTSQPAMASQAAAPLRKPLWFLLVLTGVQIFYGGLMAGNDAALFYPTFPKIGSGWIPGGLFVLTPAALNLVKNIGMIQLVHRSIGYLLALFILFLFFRYRTRGSQNLFDRVFSALPVIVLIQVLLGIITLLNSVGSIPVFYAALHQMVAVILLLAVVFLVYQSQRLYRKTVMEQNAGSAFD